MLLDRLEQLGLNQDWVRFLRTFLLKNGQNVRNHVAHGYLNNTGPFNAALAPRTTAFLTLFATAEAAEGDSAAVRAALALPLGIRPQRSLSPLGLTSSAL